MVALTTFNDWLPVIFAAVMGLAILAYVILDGYDLGVGMLMRGQDDVQQDVMIGSIGPFWDANETWLVLGIGVLLTAFPLAHGAILTALYLPVALMLLGLILRGVAFDFRAKAHANHKHAWNTAFWAGSLLATLAQGYMLGAYIVGFQDTWTAWLFGVLIAPGLVAGYCLLGACWLLMKTEGALQRCAVQWARKSLWWTAGGVAVVSIATPWASPQIFQKWFSMPNLLWLAPVPIATAMLFIVIDRVLRKLPMEQDRLCWLPFAGTLGIFVLSFFGLAYSLFPYLVVDRITIWQAASAPESLKIIFAGAVVVLPLIVLYTVFVYRIFHGKATALLYE
jgi:cytochrome bd ubiquinol oxidase subunit II